MKVKRFLFLLVLSSISLCSFSQRSDSVKAIQHFSGAASITNNGISFIPSLSLDKPAAQVILSLGGPRFSVDPDIRFDLNGRPWAFVFWTRYKFRTNNKFRITTGANLGLNFRTKTLPVDNVPVKTMEVRRYLAAELAPNYAVAKNISIGTYYFYSHGIDNGTIGNSHFVTINGNFSSIPISKQFYLRAVPQIYYLNLDGKDGYYVTSSFTVAKHGCPLSVSSIINKKFRSHIPGSKDFLWNMSLVYSFNRSYVPKQMIL